jgi:calpain-15
VVIVDDYFPYDPMSKTPAFSQSNGPELWVLLLEKAWAKINGNYEKTIAGQTHDALSFLIPGPSVYIDHDYIPDSDQAFMQQIDTSLEEDHIVCGSSNNEEGAKGVEGKGLVSFHAYSVLDLV